MPGSVDPVLPIPRHLLPGVDSSQMTRPGAGQPRLTGDSFVGNSKFTADRMAAAGNEVELAVYPEGSHGGEGSPATMGRSARERIYGVLAGPPGLGALARRGGALRGPPLPGKLWAEWMGGSVL